MILIARLLRLFVQHKAIPKIAQFRVAISHVLLTTDVATLSVPIECALNLAYALIAAYLDKKCKGVHSFSRRHSFKGFCVFFFK